MPSTASPRVSPRCRAIFHGQLCRLSMSQNVATASSLQTTSTTTALLAGAVGWDRGHVLPGKGSKQWSLLYHPYGSNAFPIRSLKISALKLAHEIWPKRLDQLQNIQTFSKNFCRIRNLQSKHRIPSESSSKCWLVEPLLSSPNTLQNIQKLKDQLKSTSFPRDKVLETWKNAPL